MTTPDINPDLASFLTGGSASLLLVAFIRAAWRNWLWPIIQKKLTGPPGPEGRPGVSYSSSILLMQNRLDDVEDRLNKLEKQKKAK